MSKRSILLKKKKKKRWLRIGEAALRKRMFADLKDQSEIESPACAALELDNKNLGQSKMGYQMFDQFTYLHFASGIVAYFWGVSLRLWFLVHTFFEIIENTNVGMKLINQYVKIWPGEGKPEADSAGNMIGDTISATLGWASAYFLDRLGYERGWYGLHITG
tara:strand:+ start:434 stop:919 length:486 start_codon:yes stop_codon:yes gene_type:complete